MSNKYFAVSELSWVNQNLVQKKINIYCGEITCCYYGCRRSDLRIIRCSSNEKALKVYILNRKFHKDLNRGFFYSFFWMDSKWFKIRFDWWKKRKNKSSGHLVSCDSVTRFILSDKAQQRIERRKKNILQASWLFL